MLRGHYPFVHYMAGNQLRTAKLSSKNAPSNRSNRPCSAPSKPASDSRAYLADWCVQRRSDDPRFPGGSILGSEVPTDIGGRSSRVLRAIQDITLLSGSHALCGVHVIDSAVCGSGRPFPEIARGFSCRMID